MEHKKKANLNNRSRQCSIIYRFSHQT